MKNVPTIHPGEVLRKQFLTPRGISRSALACAAGMSPVHINNIVLGRCDVTVDTDARLAAALGTDPCFWLELQAEFDLESGKGVKKIEGGTRRGVLTSLPAASPRPASR